MLYNNHKLNALDIFMAFDCKEVRENIKLRAKEVMNLQVIVN